jgi:stress response protein YsnF
MEEVPIVQKQLRLKEEVRIRTQRVAAEQEVRANLRRERVEFEDVTAHGLSNVPGDLARQEKRTQTKE